MTDFTYAAIAWYTPSGTYVDRSETPGTLSDADADDQFEGSDIAGPIPPHIGFVNPTYVGTLDLGGQIYPVFEDGNLFVFIPETGLPTIDYPFGLDINLDWISTGTVYQFCFAAGSLIATREGETAVEDLRALFDAYAGRADDLRRVALEPETIPVMRSLFEASIEQIAELGLEARFPTARHRDSWALRD